MPTHLPRARRLALVLPLVLALLGVSAAAAGAEDAPPTMRQEVEAWFEALRVARDADDVSAQVRFLDPAAMLARLERIGLLEEVASANKQLKVRAVVQLLLGVVVGRQWMLEPFTRMDLRKLHPRDDGTRCIAIAFLYDADGVAARTRWFLVKRAGRWVAEEVEDLDLGVGIGALMAGLLLDMDALETIGRDRESLQFREAIELMHLGDFGAAEEKFLAMERVELPRAVGAMLQMFLAICAKARGDVLAVRARVAQAREQKADMPILDFLEAEALHQIGEHEDADAALQRYEAQVGADGDTRLLHGRILLAQGRQAEAHVHLAAALEQNPTDPETLAAYARSLPPERYGELEARFLRLRHLEEDFETLGEDLLAEEHAFLLSHFAGLFAKARPAHPDGAYYRGQALSIGGQHEAAAAAFLEALGRKLAQTAEGAEREVQLTPYFDAYLGSMAEAGKHVEALEACPEPARAFTYMAAELEAEETRERLGALLARAAQLLPDSRERRYYVGAHARLEKRYDAAQAALDPLRAELAALHAADEEDEEVLDLLWSVEDRLVRVLVATGQRDRALALGRAIDERDDDALYVVLVHVAAGEVEAATAAILRGIGSQDPERFLDDPDLREPLAGPAYAKLREALAERGVR